MKKIYFSMVVIISLSALKAQSQTVLYSNNFDSYTVGGYLAVQDPTRFRTWSNAPGTAEDAVISNAFAKSPTKSVMISGTNDMLLKLGDKTTGTYELKWMMYAESGKAGYYNMQHFQTPGVVNEFAMEVYYLANGSGELYAGSATAIPFTYPKDTWFEIKHVIDLDADDIKYYVNGIMVKEWPFSYLYHSTSGTKQLGAVDFYAGAKSGSGETPKYFFDDVSNQEMPASIPTSPNWLWAKSIGGASSDAYASGSAIILDKSGNIYTTGSFSGTVDFDPGVGTANLSSAEGSGFILKTDASGNFVWVKQMGAGGVSIVVDGSGNVYSTGNFTGTADFDPGTGVFNLTSCAYGDAFISKLDEQGNFVWAKSMFGITSDAATQVSSIALDASGNVYTTGIFAGTEDFNPGTETFNITASGGVDIYISKLDNLGNFVLAKSMGGTSSDLTSNAIAIDGSGNIYTTGYFSGTVDFDPGAGIVNLAQMNGGTNSAFISKLDSSGNFVWAKQIAGTSPVMVTGNSIALDVSGNIYTTGLFTNTVDFDSGSEIFNLTSIGYGDIFVSKYNSSGNLIWAKAMGGIGSDGGASIALDSFGNVFTTGYFSKTVDFDPGAGVFNLTSIGGSDGRSAFISKLDNLGNFIWANSIVGATGGTQYSGVSCASIALDAADNAYVTGYFNTPSVSFGSIKLTKTGSSPGFIARLGDITTGIERVMKSDDGFSVYPNPTNGKFTIKSDGTVSTIEIYNLSGARVYSDFNSKKQTSNEIDLSGYAKGIYLVKIYDGKKMYSRKVVVQW